LVTSRKKKNKKPDLLLFERKVKALGYKKIAGIDEAGRGPLAGPVVASAVIVKDNSFTERIDDSKKLSPGKREKAFIEILNLCSVGIGLSTVEEIDRLNILNATLLAMKRAVADLDEIPDYLLIDGNMEVHLPQPKKMIVGGDRNSFSIACASIVAKVYRDKLMLEEDNKYPVYGFAKHKGYGTRAHIEAIREHGLSVIHRRSFGPFGDLKKGK
jgi:ribonuclease HII